MTHAFDRQRLRNQLPDLPRWVETRDLLEDANNPLVVDPTQDGAFIVGDAAGTMSVVRRPQTDLIRSFAVDYREALAFDDNVEHVAQALPSWIRDRAWLHALPEHVKLSSPRYEVRWLTDKDLPFGSWIPVALAKELKAVFDADEDIAAALDETQRPVSFAYVVAQTETWWDLSIDTVPSHRRRGFAQSAVTWLIHQMEDEARPVWGAAESNPASSALARRLGFEVADAIWLFSRAADEL